MSEESVVIRTFPPPYQYDESHGSDKHFNFMLLQTDTMPAIECGSLHCGSVTKEPEQVLV